MSITLINRVTGASNNIVYLETSDSTATALAANYILNQASVIRSINEGAWTWQENDLIILSASDGVTLCGINAAFTTLISMASTADTFGVQTAVFSLTAAEFNALNSTPIAVVASPGTGMIIVPELVVLNLQFNSAQYAAGGVLGFYYDSAATTLATTTVAAADITGAAASTVYKFLAANGTGSEVLVSDGADSGLYISNETADFTTGDSPFIGFVAYRVMSVA